MRWERGGEYEERRKYPSQLLSVCVSISFRTPRRSGPRNWGSGSIALTLSLHWSRRSGHTLIKRPIGFAGMLWSLMVFPHQVSRLTMGSLSNPSLQKGIVHHPLTDALQPRLFDWQWLQLDSMNLHLVSQLIGVRTARVPSSKLYTFYFGMRITTS